MIDDPYLVTDALSDKEAVNVRYKILQFLVTVPERYQHRQSVSLPSLPTSGLTSWLAESQGGLHLLNLPLSRLHLVLVEDFQLRSLPRHRLRAVAAAWWLRRRAEV